MWRGESLPHTLNDRFEHINYFVNFILFPSGVIFYFNKSTKKIEKTSVTDLV